MPSTNNILVSADVLHYSSFEFMRDLARKDSFMEDYLRGNTSGSRTPQSDKKKPVMMRRGTVGDWRNHLSPEQSRTIDRLLEERVPDMVDTWREVMWTRCSRWCYWSREKPYLVLQSNVVMGKKYCLQKLWIWLATKIWSFWNTKYFKRYFYFTLLLNCFERYWKLCSSYSHLVVFSKMF